MKNSEKMNQSLPNTIAQFIKWDDDRGITTGSTPNAQFTKLLEEVCELFASLNPEMSKNQLKFELQKQIQVLHGKGKIKPVPEGDDPHIHTVDAIGDIQKCLTSVANLSNISVGQASVYALNEIQNRGGQLINGVWEKN